MKKRVSLKDIAKEAGVSIATVSYVLSKQNNTGISREVTERIKRIAAELNYRPNQIAKSLQSGKSHTIGLIVADISNPFFALIARIVEDEAKKHGYTVIFGSSDEKASKSADLIKFLLNRQVDGFIIAPAEGSKDQIEYLKAQNVPLVLIDRYFPKLETNYVVIENYLASFEATGRLLANGNNRIGMVAYATEMQHMQERIRGYRDALAQDGISDTFVHEIKFSAIQSEVEGAVDQMLNMNDPVDAIFFATNTLGIIGLKYLNRLKVSIPKDVSVIVFDESEAFDFFYCPLTYVKQPLHDMAKKAVEVLVEQIADPNKGFHKIKLGAKLVLGDSCA
ncbi:LacI family DNA-binding transcriptional regulator [Flagellimonas pelagia]|uniref:LacI family transcriptional regulator n=1 Tax=Flagellimonas pelagia TaxID=2306998 RepID=A0A3A1NDD0_9FLAO|nr:substrate-binding domain-containing protein [Allomuricauda maritima]RIV42482.1 LacI family transcriptional regulator [Allomuricauda maritima]TXJ91510.1 LacI family transcriptional regulator [Allomuricauda maritima]